LGKPNDILFAITTSGNSKNVLKAIEVAHTKNIKVVAMSGRDGGKLNELLKPDDIHICVPNDRTLRIQEVHILVIHCLCDAVDTILFGEK
jgi:D-sedoheptulose 7-phosphate isomerase